MGEGFTHSCPAIHLLCGIPRPIRFGESLSRESGRLFCQKEFNKKLLINGAPPVRILREIILTEVVLKAADNKQR